MVPNLSGSNVLRDESSYVACIIRNGSDPNSAIAEYFTPMPSFKNLSSTEISNIMNFMNNSWGNKLPMITPYDVEDALQECPEY